MKGKVFISYRRQDARADARSIYQRLERAFGARRLFMDVDTIQRGADFRHVLEQHLEESTALLALIGPGWASADEQGRRRLDDPHDFVRLEIATALKRGIPVIPILLDGAQMPDPQHLPQDVRDLVFRQAARVGHDNFPRDMDAVERDLRRLLKEGGGSSRRLAAAVLAAVVVVAGGSGYFLLGPERFTPPSAGPARVEQPTPVVPAAVNQAAAPRVEPTAAKVTARADAPPVRQPTEPATKALPAPLAPAEIKTAANRQPEPPSPSPPPGRMVTGQAVRAEEYRIVRNVPVAACASACERDQKCRMYAHWYGSTCYLFDREHETYPSTASVAGTVASRAR